MQVQNAATGKQASGDVTKDSATARSMALYVLRISTSAAVPSSRKSESEGSKKGGDTPNCNELTSKPATVRPANLIAGSFGTVHGQPHPPMVDQPACTNGSKVTPAVVPLQQ
jgi:hypothetical protein